MSVLPRALIEKFLVRLDKDSGFGWKRVTFKDANAEVQKKSHDIRTHAQKRTKMDTCEDEKEKTRILSSQKENDGFFPFSQKMPESVLFPVVRQKWQVAASGSTPVRSRGACACLLLDLAQHLLVGLWAAVCVLIRLLCLWRDKHQHVSQLTPFSVVVCNASLEFFCFLLA